MKLSPIVYNSCAERNPPKMIRDTIYITGYLNLFRHTFTMIMREFFIFRIVFLKVFQLL